MPTDHQKDTAMLDIRDSILTPITLTAILLFACSSSDDKSETSGKPAAAKKAPLEYKPIAWMGLKAKVAKDADISDTSADAPAAMVYSNGCTVMLSTVTAAYGNFDASVKEAEKGLGNKVTKWLVKEKTADGFTSSSTELQ